MGKNNINLKDDFIKKIKLGKFLRAKKEAENLSFEELTDCLLEISFENQNILSYVFINYLISNTESAKLHTLASTILCSGLCHLNGAYQAAFFHAQQAIVLEPQNIDNKEELLYFYGNPEKLISQAEAIDIAKEVLKKNLQVYQPKEL